MLETGDPEKACDVLNPIRELCLKHRIFAMEPVVSGVLASALCACEEAQSALAITSFSIEKQFYKSAARHAWYFLFSSHATALAATGNTQEAIENLQRIVNDKEEASDPSLVVQSCILLGYVFLSKGETDSSIKIFERALQMAERGRMLPSIARARFGLCECYPFTNAQYDIHRKAGAEISRSLGVDVNRVLHFLRKL